MTVLLSIRKLQKTYGTRDVLKNINVDIKKGERIGLVGRNGAGKTTLANILTQSIRPDAGELHHFINKLNIGYLKQTTEYTENPINEVLKTTDIEQTQDFIKISTHLGITKINDWEDERFSEISGGEKTKLAIAKVWAAKPELLILDEPTNHLDFKGVEWLIDQLKVFEGTVIIISHDRYFLDQTVERIWEIEDSHLKEYIGNYSSYQEEKERQFQNQLHQYEEQKKIEGKIQAEVTQLKNWSNKAHEGARKKAIETGMKFGGKEHYRAKAKKRDKQVKSKIKRLEKLQQDGVTKPKEEQKVNFEFRDADKSGKRILDVKGLAKQKGGKSLFQNSAFYVKRGERVGLVGPNGCGKTTLIEMLIGKEPVDQGEIWISPTSKIGYLSQDVHDLDDQMTALDMIKMGGLRERELQGQSILVNMGFNREMMERQIKYLSLGERTKIKLAKLMIDQYPIIFLDEPTNHLDLPSREQLEKTLLEYNGTLVLVSHDRYMLEKLCDKLIVFENEQLKRYEDRFSEYMSKADKSKKTGKLTKQELLEQKMVVDTKITRILGLLQRYKPEDEEYMKLDQEYNELIKEKRALS